MSKHLYFKFKSSNKLEITHFIHRSHLFIRNKPIRCPFNEQIYSRVKRIDLISVITVQSFCYWNLLTLFVGYRHGVEDSKISHHQAREGGNCFCRCQHFNDIGYLSRYNMIILILLIL